ncbi:MAG TPA: PAS domain S-box protein [Polyangia bacterium]
MKSRVKLYGRTIAALAVAVGARWALDPWLRDTLPLVTLFGATAYAVWRGGPRLAALVAVVGYVACDFLFIAPRTTFAIPNAEWVFRLLAYLLVTGLIVALGAATRAAQARATRQGELLRLLRQERAGKLVTEHVLAAIVASSDDGIISKSLDGIIQTWNAGAERIFGYTAAEAIGRHISLVIPPERLSEEDQIIANLKAGRRIDHFETVRLRRDGQRIYVSLTISPINDDTGRVVGASKIVRDVTERKRAEAEREKFVTLVETSTDFIGICDLEGSPIFINRAGLDLVGIDDMEQALRMSLRSFFFPEDQDRVIKEFLPSVLDKGHGEIEVRFRHFKTGEARWMAYKVLTLPDAAGRPIAFATVSQDVTERKRLADNLRALASDLSEADRRKNEFIATLAHELRNPLAPISNAVRVLRRGDGDASASRTAFDMLERQVGQLSRLVDDLLDLSRVTRGRIELRKEPVELRTVARQAVEAVQSLYGHMRHDLTVSLPDKPLQLEADPTRLAQILGNLLNNACKFTDRGGRIAVTVERVGGQAVILVRDNGIGVAPEQMPRLFEMFAQAESSLERTRDGLGIGLTLVKTLVEMHGGTVVARSEGLGQGCEFEVRLPALPETFAGSREPRAVAPVRAVSSRRVLVVDDNLDGAESLAMLLELEGHEAHVAHDGLSAIAAAERLAPDAVLLDIGLPGMNGYEICRRLRETTWGKRLTIIALTGWGQEEDRRRSKAAGFDGHLVKPVDSELLLKLLADLGGPRASGEVRSIEGEDEPSRIEARGASRR